LWAKLHGTRTSSKLNLMDRLVVSHLRSCSLSLPVPSRVSCSPAAAPSLFEREQRGSLWRTRLAGHGVWFGGSPARAAPGGRSPQPNTCIQHVPLASSSGTVGDRRTWLRQAEQDADRVATRPGMPEAEYMTGLQHTLGMKSCGSIRNECGMKTEGWSSLTCSLICLRRHL
jgi:hypothetical protein